MKTILLFILCTSVFAQENSNAEFFFKLGLDDNGEVVRVISEDPLKFQAVEAEDSKDRMVLKLFKDEIKSKNKMSLACTAVTEKKDGVLYIKELRICSKVKGNELLYKSFDLTAKDTETELKIVGKLLNNELSPGSITKHINDSEREFEKRAAERNAFFNDESTGSKIRQK